MRIRGGWACKGGRGLYLLFTAYSIGQLACQQKAGKISSKTPSKFLRFCVQ